METVYRKNVIVELSRCGRDCRLSVPAVFEAFQDIAVEHAELLGLGFDAMNARGLFWITAKTKVRILRRPKLLAPITVETWPCLPGPVRADRCYRILEGGETVAEGRTEWAVIEVPALKVHRLSDIYPEGMKLSDEVLLPEHFRRVPEDTSDCTERTPVLVRSTDIDLGKHMNNIAYIREMLSTYTTGELGQMNIKSLEVCFRHPCYEGETLRVFERKTESGREIVMKKEDGSPAFFALIDLGDD